MVTAQTLAEKLERLDVSLAARQAIEATKPTIVKIQREQLFQGVKADGRGIRPLYARSTIAYKKRTGQPYDRVTLRDHGDFYSGIRVDVGADSYSTDSTDWKSFKLKDRYGEDIFGLNYAHRADYVTELKPVFTRILKDQLK